MKRRSHGRDERSGKAVSHAGTARASLQPLIQLSIGNRWEIILFLSYFLSSFTLLPSGVRKG